jgi:hypothetical protein
MYTPVKRAAPKTQRHSVHGYVRHYQQTAIH